MKFVRRVQMRRQLFDEMFHRANVRLLEVVQSRRVQFDHRTGIHRMIVLNETMAMRKCSSAGKEVRSEQLQE